MKLKVLLLILSIGLLSQSCIVNPGEKGNGKIVTQDRSVEPFNGVAATAGISVILIPGDKTQVKVEADENLQHLIQTHTENGVLKIGVSKNIRFARAKKVYVTYEQLETISVSSGSSITSDDILKSQKLSLKGSSGGSARLEILSEDLTVVTSSGADIKLSGKVINLDVKASSGSDVNAKELQTVNGVAQASSGGSVKVNVKDRISMRASSGGDVTYYGNPQFVESSESSSGNIRKKQ